MTGGENSTRKYHSRVFDYCLKIGSGQVVSEHIFSKYLLRFFKTDFFKVFGKVQLAKSRKKNQFTSLILAWLSIMYKLCFLDTALRLIGLNI